MEHIEKLNQLLAFIKIKDLTPHEQYRIEKLERQSTKYGEAILATLFNKGRLYLPGSVADELLREDGKQLFQLKQLVQLRQLHLVFENNLKFKCIVN